MKRKSLLSNAAGVSLIETIVAVTIVGVSALAFAQLSVNFGEVRKYIQTSISYRDFMANVEDTLSTNDRCLAALGGQTAPPIPGATANVTLRLPRETGAVGSTVAYSTGGNVYLNNDANSGILISRVELLNSSTAIGSTTGSPIQNVQISNAGVISPAIRYYMTLTVAAQRVNSGRPGQLSLGGGFRPRAIGLNVVTNAANVILRCNSDANMEQACLEAGGVFLAGPPESCNLKNTMGGCIFGGSYGIDDGACSWQNPATGGCTCPTGYSGNQLLDFNAVKGKGTNMIELWNCYKCT